MGLAPGTAEEAVAQSAPLVSMYEDIKQEETAEKRFPQAEGRQGPENLRGNHLHIKAPGGPKGLDILNERI